MGFSYILIKINLVWTGVMKNRIVLLDKSPKRVHINISKQCLYFASTLNYIQNASRTITYFKVWCLNRCYLFSNNVIVSKYTIDSPHVEQLWTIRVRNYLGPPYTVSKHLEGMFFLLFAIIFTFFTFSTLAPSNCFTKYTVYVFENI